MTKICYVIGTLKVGGAEKQLYYLVKNLDKNKFSPTIIALRGGILEPDFKKICKLKIIGKKFKIDPFSFLKLIFIIREEKTDILHTYMFTANTWGRLAGIICKIPVKIVSERSVDLWKKNYHFLIDKILGKFTDKIICVSEEVRNHYLKKTKLPSDKFIVIENGVDLQEIEKIKEKKEIKEEFGIQNDDFVILTGGRLCKEKSIDFFLSIVPELKKQITNLKILIAGEGEEKENLLNITKYLKLEDNVIFTGYRRDILSIIKISDLVVLTSKWEGMPNLILEGMALKKAVISTNVGGCKEIIQNNVNGFLIEYGDKKHLIEKILFLYKNSGEREKMGESGYKIVKEKFDLIVKIKEYEKIYSSFDRKNFKNQF